MEKDRRSKGGELSETGDEKDTPDGAVVIPFNSRRSIKEYKSFIKQHIKDGNQVFFFLALAGDDLEKVKKLAESFKGKHGIVSVREGSPINSAETKGVVTLFRPNFSNESNPSAVERARGVLKRLSSRK